MALTVPQPASSSDQFGWLFHNNNCYLDASIYQDDDDIMDFSDSSVEYLLSYQPSQQQYQHQVSINLTLMCATILLIKQICC